jgi:hypothetical protein
MLLGDNEPGIPVSEGWQRDPAEKGTLNVLGQAPIAILGD